VTSIPIATAMIIKPTPITAAYVGNSNTRVYHYANCTYVAGIATPHIIQLNSTQEATEQGYRPCAICQPLK
jgi:micrococcal nuclease